MRRICFTSASLILTILGVFTGAVAHASAWTPSSYADRLSVLVNNARAQAGLAPVRVEIGSSNVAAWWTSRLASNGALAHNPHLYSQLRSHGSPYVRTYGENVGEGPTSSPDVLFRAYMRSPEHRANILDSGYRFLGISAVFSGSEAWNTMDFVDSYGGRQAAPRVAPPTSVSQPRPVSPAVRRTTVARPVAKPAPVAVHRSRVAVKALHVVLPSFTLPTVTVSAVPVANVVPSLTSPTSLIPTPAQGRPALLVIAAAAILALVLTSWLAVARSSRV